MKERNGWLLRRPTVDDAPAIAAIYNSHEHHVLGYHATTPQEIRMDLTFPNVNLHNDAWLVLHPQTEEPVGFFCVDDDTPHTNVTVIGRVHQDYVGQGIGWLGMELLEERGRQAFQKAPPQARISLKAYTYGNDKLSPALFKDWGYALDHRFWRMQIELDQDIPEPEWPDGLRVVTAESFDDYRPIHAASMDAFQDHYGFVPMEYETWLHYFQGQSARFDPSLWFLVMDGDDIAAIALNLDHLPEDTMLGYLDELAVRRPWRRRGLATALLRHSFRAFQARKKERACLHVDSTNLTGATRLYERAGMSVVRETHQYRKVLREGVELAIESLEDAQTTTSV